MFAFPLINRSIDVIDATSHQIGKQNKRRFKPDISFHITLDPDVMSSSF